MTQTVAIVGVGNMGGGMAAHLLAQGWGVRAHDIDASKVNTLAAQGAVVAAAPGECAAPVAITIICVVDAQQTHDVLFGAGGVAAAVRAGHTVMLCPTISPQDVEAIAQRLAAQGLHAIDAPMSGGPARARDGSMSLMVACADAVFNQHSALVNTLSSRVFRISQRPGDGARTKLVNNLLAGINLVGAAEVLALAGRLGLDLDRTLDVIEQSSGQSWIGSDRMRRAIAGDYAPRAHVTLLQKDTRLAMQAAQAAGFEGPLGAAARDTFARAGAAGFDALDDAAIYRLLSE
jgi:3-hydroxyisobutyrate dehydrogenase